MQQARGLTYIYENVKTYTYARPTFTHKIAGSTIHMLTIEDRRALDAITTFFSIESNDSESTLFHSAYYINLDRALKGKNIWKKHFRNILGVLKE